MMTVLFELISMAGTVDGVEDDAMVSEPLASKVMFPELAYFVIFGPMALLLAFRPLGLFGRATTA